MHLQIGAAEPAAQHPISVCALAAHPDTFANKTVALKGKLNSDGIERVVLTSADCEDFGIAITTPGHFKGEDAFVKALQTGHPGTLDKTIRGLFIGTFKLQKGEVPSRILILKEARELEVTMKAPHP